MTRADRAKRDKFIESAVSALQECANKQGYGRISKETLALLFQRYKERYNPPRLPKRANKPRLKVVK